VKNNDRRMYPIEIRDKVIYAIVNGGLWLEEANA